MGSPGTAVGEFEAIVTDTVTDFGARVAKLIGDEVTLEMVVALPRNGPPSRSPSPDSAL